MANNNANNMNIATFKAGNIASFYFLIDILSFFFSSKSI